MNNSRQVTLPLQGGNTKHNSDTLSEKIFPSQSKFDIIDELDEKNLSSDIDIYTNVIVKTMRT